jgi:hypothetical protein
MPGEPSHQSPVAPTPQAAALQPVWHRPPSGRAPACVAQAASGAPPCTGEVRGRRTSNAPPPPGDRRRTAGPCRARARCPVRRPRPRQSADLGRDCSEPNPATRTSSESRLPVARSQRHGRASVEANPHPLRRARTAQFTIRPAAPSLGLDRMQSIARKRSVVQPVAAGAVRNAILHRGHSVVTQRTWLQHIQ